MSQTTPPTWNPQQGPRSPQELYRIAAGRAESLPAMQRGTLKADLQRRLFRLAPLLPQQDQAFQNAVLDASLSVMVPLDIPSLTFEQAAFWLVWIRRYAQTHAINLKPLSCWFPHCSAAVLDDEAAAERHWTPYFWLSNAGRDQMITHPVCPACTDAHLTRDDESGEMGCDEADLPEPAPEGMVPR